MEAAFVTDEKEPTTPQSADTAGVGPEPEKSRSLGLEEIVARLRSSDIKYVIAGIVVRLEAAEDKLDRALKLIDKQADEIAQLKAQQSEGRQGAREPFASLNEIMSNMYGIPSNERTTQLLRKAWLDHINGTECQRQQQQQQNRSTNTNATPIPVVNVGKAPEKKEANPDARPSEGQEPLFASLNQTMSNMYGTVSNQELAQILGEACLDHINGEGQRQQQQQRSTNTNATSIPVVNVDNAAEKKEAKPGASQSVGEPASSYRMASNGASLVDVDTLGNIAKMHHAFNVQAPGLFGGFGRVIPVQIGDRIAHIPTSTRHLQRPSDVQQLDDFGASIFMKELEELAERSRRKIAEAIEEAIEEEFIARQQQQQSSAQKQGVYRVDFNTTVSVQQDARVIRQQQRDAEWAHYVKHFEDIQELTRSHRRPGDIDRGVPSISRNVKKCSSCGKYH